MLLLKTDFTNTHFTETYFTTILPSPFGGSGYFKSIDLSVLDQHIRHHVVPIPLVIGRHDIPRCVFSGTTLDRIVVGIHVFVPQPPIRRGRRDWNFQFFDFTSMRSIIRSFCSSLEMCRKNLIDRRAGAGEHRFELIDLFVPGGPDRFGDELFYALGRERFRTASD